MSSETTQAAFAARPLAVAQTWRREVRDTLLLTMPIAGGLLAEMGMGVIDYSMAGHLGPSALAAAGLGLQLMFTPMLWGMGAIAATGAVGAQAHGAGDAETVSESMRQGFLMATLLSLPIMAVLVALLPLLPLVELPGAQSDVVLRDVRHIIYWGLPWVPLTYWYTVLRNFVTVMQRPAIVTVCSIAGLPVSFLSNFIFMYGAWGAPKLGVEAVGLTNTIVALLHLIMIVAYVEWVPSLRHYRVFARLLHFDARMMAELFRVGVPIAMSYLFESGLFFIATILMLHISVIALAAHNVVLNICAMSFMIPYALSQAATVRVGYAVGAKQLEAARRAGYVAIGLGVFWMLMSASMMWSVPRLLTSIYLDMADSANADVIELAASLFVIAAVFQVVDGTQVTTQGALRGIKDTAVPMVLCGLGYWVFGLGSAASFAFVLGYGAVGLWWGLAIGLAVSASLLFLRWRRLSGRLIA